MWKGSARASGYLARLLALVGMLAPALALMALPVRAEDGGTKVPMAERVDILARTYPDAIYSVTRNVIRTMSNRHVVIDDEQEKPHWAKLKGGADIEDQLAQIYPVGTCYRGRQRDFDPGAVRSDAFFGIAYGSNEHMVTRETEVIDWFGQPIRFSRRHGAADALKRVLADLKGLPENLLEVVKPIERTVDWTVAPDGERVSEHAYGIAIDINPQFGNRWRYVGRKTRRLIQYNNRVHPEVIEVFERHGFIWGGKWYHFETNHFEYRPEMIAIGQLALERGCEK